MTLTRKLVLTGFLVVTLVLNWAARHQPPATDSICLTLVNPETAATDAY